MFKGKFVKGKLSKRVISATLSAAMIVTGISIPAATKEAQAEVYTETVLNVNDDDYSVENLFDDTWEGMDSDDGESLIKESLGIESTAYYKLVYEVENAALRADSDELFVFTPSAEGVETDEEYHVHFGAGSYNDEAGVYTAYVKVLDIKDMFKPGVDCDDISLSFANTDYDIRLDGLYALKAIDKPSKAELYNSDAEAVTDTTFVVNATVADMKKALNDAGLESPLTENYANTKYYYKAYVQVSQAHTYSVFGVGVYGSGASNESLTGIYGTTGGTILGVVHCGYGTGHVGEGYGAKGTGIYEFKGKDTGSRWSGQEEDVASIKLFVKTKDTKVKLLGINLYTDGNKTVPLENANFKAVYDEAGNYTGLECGFENPDSSLIESVQKDASDEKPKSETVLFYEAEEELWSNIRKAKLLTVDDCDSEEAYNNIQEAIPVAEAALKGDAATLESLTKALEEFNEVIKSVITDEVITKARYYLQMAIDKCKEYKEADYEKESWDNLQTAIANAEADMKDLNANYDRNDIDGSRLLYKGIRDTLGTARARLIPNMSTEPASPKEFRILSKAEVVDEMGAGINLGNTFDGGLTNASETGWQSFTTTKAYIKALHDAGYNTVRIPVTWNGYINDDFSIRESWMARVQEVVDYCVDQDMYAIINIHHDGAANHDNRGDNPQCWLNTYADDIEGLYQKFAGVWKTIAERFKDYDEHLIFEDMNEVTDAHGTAPNEDTTVLNNLNQLFINTVRATGSNNTKRWLAITGRFNAFSSGTKMPQDKLADMGSIGTTRLMFSVHIYKGSYSTRWTYSGDLNDFKNSLTNSVNNVKKLDENMPLYVGEYGTANQKQTGSETGYNNAERALYSEYVHALCNYYDAIPVVWDQGGSSDDYKSIDNYYNNGGDMRTGTFLYWNRPGSYCSFEDIADAMIRGSDTNYGDKELSTILSDIYKSYGHSDTSDNSVSKDPVIKEAKNLVFKEETFNMKPGERASLNDMYTVDMGDDLLVWKTDDDSVVTVAKGRLHAKKMGTTFVWAESLSGSEIAGIKIIVGKPDTATATDINLESEEITIGKGDTAQINATLVPSDSKDKISYIISDDTIATVSNDGLVMGKKIGGTYVIVQTESGIQKTVKINVVKSENKIDVALNTYGDYTVVGDPITLTDKVGAKYTVTLDASKLSDLPSLNGCQAIYIKQTEGNPILKSCTIRYTSIKVDGVSMNINTSKKNVIKGNVFDSGNPINGWDGSCIDGVTANANHEVYFDGMDNPQKLEVTFAVDKIVFLGEVEEEIVPATSLESQDGYKIFMEDAGETKGLTITVNPANTTEKVTFVSDDMNVIMVDSKALTPDEDGNVYTTLTSTGKGKTYVHAFTSDGLKIDIKILVGVEDDPEPSTEPSTEPGTDPSSNPDASQEPAPTPAAPAPQTSATPAPQTVAPATDTNNPVSSIKAMKKQTSIKRGKNGKIVIKVTATDNSKATTDEVKVAGLKKIAKLGKIVKKAGKVVIKVKGLKKGKTNAKVTIGSKSVIVKLVIK